MTSLPIFLLLYLFFIYIYLFIYLFVFIFFFPRGRYEAAFSETTVDLAADQHGIGSAVPSHLDRESVVVYSDSSSAVVDPLRIVPNGTKFQNLSVAATLRAPFPKKEEDVLGEAPSSADRSKDSGRKERSSSNQRKEKLSLGSAVPFTLKQPRGYDGQAGARRRSPSQQQQLSSERGHWHYYCCPICKFPLVALSSKKDAIAIVGAYARRNVLQ